jgi:hypothetical protein
MVLLVRLLRWWWGDVCDDGVVVLLLLPLKHQPRRRWDDAVNVTTL